MPRCRLLLGAMLVVCVASAADIDAAPPRPNFILLLADDQRPDTIHALGNKLIETPNLDRLVAEGTTFPRAITAFPICNQSRIELMTGCTIFRGDTFAPGKGPGQPIVPWAETLRKAGYRTYHVGKWHNAQTPRHWGYQETRGLFVSGGAKYARHQTDHAGREVTGYKAYVFKTPDGKVDESKTLGGLTPDVSHHFADAAIELIERKTEEPFFLHVNFTAPHDPLFFPPGYETKYRAADMPLPANFLPQHPFDHGNFDGRDEQLFRWPRTPEETRDELACYYAVISDLDAQVGRILAALDRTGQAENTIVIYSADHGLAIGSHGLRGKQNMYEHTVGVPLLVRGPGIPKGERCHAQVYLRDLYPTACDLAGVTVPATVEGKSLVPLFTHAATEIYPFVVSYFRDVQRAIRTDRWKLIEYPQVGRTQLFDMVADRDELRDLSADPQHANDVKELHATLHAWLKEHGDPLEKN
jgi:arylsulfatase A-like enzyme